MTHSSNSSTPSNPDSFPSKTAGRLMITNVPIALSDFTVGDARKHFQKNLATFESINYLYIVNKNHRMVGVLSLRDLLRLPADNELAEVMRSPLITVHPHTDQEKVAYLAMKNSLKSVPVVDKDDKFLGIVPSDAILDITFQEAQEDLLRFAGIQSSQNENIMKIPRTKSLYHRLPWLVLGMFGYLITARVINSYQAVISKDLLLVGFLPLVAYTASAISTQMQVFFIRDTALTPKIKIIAYFKRHFSIVVLMALIISASLWLITSGVYHQILLPTILSLAIFASILSSLFTGLAVPTLFRILKVDPANISGPIGTTLQDLISITIYLTIASIIL